MSVFRLGDRADAARIHGIGNLWQSWQKLQIGQNVGWAAVSSSDY
jgi:hypothetical protein